jgi:hypothetical protein
MVNIVGKSLTLIGAGIDRTILDGGGLPSSQSVLVVFTASALVRQLTVTGANEVSAIVVAPLGALTLQEVSVIGNHKTSSGGGGITNDAQLILEAGATISGNSASNGGGIDNGSAASVTLKTGSSVTGNTATGGSSAIFAGGIFNHGTVVKAGGIITDNTPNNCVNSGGVGC